jgi:glucose/arabinose dehydrogenase/mono/diheme cytochrome c family protein
MKKIIFPCTIVVGIWLFAASTSSYRNYVKASAIDSLTEAPVLSPQESLKQMQVEKGFKVQLIAAEPLVNTPVAMTFDEKGRMWVAEMEGYMRDTLGTGEDIPNGKIVILEDTNKDGIMDKRKVFMDSLVLPRALCLIEGGIMIAQNPKVWYVQINNDKPGKKTLVDDNYTEGGNVEHEPNGLMRALDNWIYNAKSTIRYRKNGNVWLKQKTHFRGQWGIAQDNYGRLFYNTNSQNIIGDFFSPGFGAGNINQQAVAGFNVPFIKDNRVYPARPNSGVNRGYSKGTLDANLRLIEFTAAAGLAIYRGDLFGKDYDNNAFVPEPSANLIKRNILEEKGYQVLGRQAYAGKEFLTSKDERFRPVSLYNGPDGALYVVDMYRGIIQHRTYITGYLKSEVKKRNLSQPDDRGRIYKIVPENKTATNVIMPADPQKLVSMLGHPNGWVRDKAQQLLVDKKSASVLPALRNLLKKTDNPLAVIHALWTIEGLHALSSADVLPLLKSVNWHIRTEALSTLPSVLNKQNYQTYVAALDQLLANKDAYSAPYIAFLASYIQPFNPGVADRLLTTVMKAYPQDPYIADAVISSLKDRESDFLKEVIAYTPDENLVIRKQLEKVLTIIKNRDATKNATKTAERNFPKGAQIFRSTCQPCHGADGNGTPSLAPPLNKSEWVNGDKNKLIPIVLFGLTGPIKVNGHIYTKPEINGDMPGIGQNIEFNEGDIAILLSYIRNAWGNSAEAVKPDDVGKARLKFPNRQRSFTMEELNQLK